MPSLQTPSTDITAELHQIDSRLQALREIEDGNGARLQTPIMRTAIDQGEDEATDVSQSPTLNGDSSLQSGCTTPKDTQPGTTAPSRPPLPTDGPPSMIQFRKKQTKVWYKYPRKGYKVTTKFFYQEIDSSWTAVLLVACFFVSGLVDAVAFGVWSVFVSMQTGNTIFLALRISNQPETHHALNYVKSLVSLASYCLGALLFNILHRAPTGLSNSHAPLHRWTLLTSFVIQSALLTTVAILAQLHIISSIPYQGGTFSSGTPSMPGDNYYDLIGISLLAFEAAGQVCLSRVLLVNELPTIVLSTVYHDLIGEGLGTIQCWRQSKTKWDFAVRQKKQIRRIACIIFLFAGALVGGFVFRSKAGLSGALWIAVVIKVGICVAWCLWKKKVVTETVVTRGNDVHQQEK